MSILETGPNPDTLTLNDRTVHFNRVRSVIRNAEARLYTRAAHRKSEEHIYMLARQHAQNYRKCERHHDDPDHVCVMGAEVWRQLRQFPPRLQVHAVSRCFEGGEWNFCTAHNVVTEIRIRLAGGETEHDIILRDQTPQRFGTRE